MRFQDKRTGGGGAGHLGAAVARAQNVEALDVAVDDADQLVVQVGEGAGRLARRPDALVCGGGEILCESVVPAAARHPLHDDEGVGRFQAGAEYLHAVRVVDLHEMLEDGVTTWHKPLAFRIVVTSRVNVFSC